MRRDLEQAALSSPRDETKALMLAEVLLQIGDPRGEIISLEHALWKRPGAAMQTKLEQRLEELARSEGPRVIGRPAGFPLQRVWGTRRHHVFHDRWQMTEREELGRVRGFLVRYTNADLSRDLDNVHRFRLVHPDTRVPFPFQAGVHYGKAGDFGSVLTLVLEVDTGRADLELNIPLECYLEVFELRGEMFEMLGRPWLAERSFERRESGFAIDGRLRDS